MTEEDAKIRLVVDTTCRAMEVVIKKILEGSAIDTSDDKLDSTICDIIKIINRKFSRDGVSSASAASDVKRVFVGKPVER